MEEVSSGKLLPATFHHMNDIYHQVVTKIANPAIHRSMPVKIFGRPCEKMMKEFEIEGDGIDNVDISMFLQRYV